MKISKLQTPNSREAPNHKLQMTDSAGRFGIWSLVLLWSWSLEFGASPPPQRLCWPRINWLSVGPTTSSPSPLPICPAADSTFGISKPSAAKDQLAAIGGKLFCRTKTQLVSANPKHLRFRTTVEPEVEVLHDVRAGTDEVEIRFELKNHGQQPVDLEWFSARLHPRGSIYRTEPNQLHHAQFHFYRARIDDDGQDSPARAGALPRRAGLCPERKSIWTM